MPDNADWISPKEAELLVATKMGLTVGCPEVREALQGWINNDMISMHAAEVVRWESRYYHSYLLDFERRSPVDQTKHVEVSFLLSGIQTGRLESNRFWHLAELSVWLERANPNARAVYTGIRLRLSDIEHALELSDFTGKSPSVSAGRAPSVKVGSPPNENEILAKAEEMKARGLDGRTIAKKMRLEPGFENVATTAVRELIKGRWRPAGRPKKSA